MACFQDLNTNQRHQNFLQKDFSFFFEREALPMRKKQFRTVLGSVLQPPGWLRNSNGSQHTDLDTCDAQPPRSEKFKPALDYLLQQVCTQSVLRALGMQETFIVVGSFGFKMAIKAEEQRMEPSCFHLKRLFNLFWKKPPPPPSNFLQPPWPSDQQSRWKRC